LIQAVPIIILILCIIAIISSVAIIFNKKLKFIKKLEAKKVTADLNLVNKEVSEGIVSLPTAEYLADTSINNDFKNSSLMEKYLEKIITTLKQHNIEYIKKVITIMPVFSQIQFQFKSENECEEILKLNDKFLLAFHNERLLILSKGNYVIFEFINKDPSKIGFKQLFKKAGKNKLPIGINLDKKVVCADFENNQNIFVVGKVGSGTSMIITTLIVNFAYMHNPKDSEIVILENNARAGNLLRTFDDLPHITNKDTIGNEKCKSYIENILKTKLTKKTLIVFNEFENFVKVSYTNRELIIKLLHFAATNKLCHVVLASKVVDNNSAGDDIYSLFDEKFILKTESEKESMELLNSPRAYQLCGFGDTFFLDKTNHRERIQTSYISKNELVSIIEIINTFFSSLNNKK
jgi:DNA segregation ATPase FtsK/SpoIIIE-like protein